MKVSVSLSNCPLPPIERKRLCWMVKDYLDEVTTPEQLLNLQAAFTRSTRPYLPEYNRLISGAFRYATQRLDRKDISKWKLSVEILSLSMVTKLPLLINMGLF